MGILLKFRSSSSSILQHSSQQEQQPAAAEQQQPPPPPADQQQLQTSCSSRPVAAEQQLQQSRGEAAAIKFQQQQRLRVLKMCFSVFPWSMTASSFSALFYSALLCAREMLAHEDGSADQDLLRALNNRLLALSFHIREYYWTDMKKLNEIFRYKTEEYSFDAVNKFNIYPDQISPWFVEWMPDKGGYFIGNLQPTHMDFCFFSLGNLWSIVNSLATTQQSHAILDLVEAKLSDLVADMPFKICCTALEGQEWRIITANDPKKHAMVIP